MAKPTLRHVALAAGVSTASVSRILNGSTAYSDDTIARVKQAASDLRYRPNAVARATRTGSGRLVGALVDRRSTRATAMAPRVFWLHFVDELLDCLCEQGAGMVAVSSDRVELLQALPLDSLIVVSGQPDRSHFEMAGKIPTAGFGNDPSLTIGVSHDFRGATLDALAYLENQGAVKPGILTSAHEPRLSELFVQAYCAAMSDRDRAPIQAVFDDEPTLGEALDHVVARGADGLFVVGGVSRAVRDLMRSQNYELPLIVQSEGLVEQYMEPPVATLSLCARRSAHRTIAVESAVRDGMGARAPEDEEPASARAVPENELVLVECAFSYAEHRTCTARDERDAPSGGGAVQVECIPLQ